MDAPLDLYRASREELIALVLDQREQIADLEREHARLRAELAAQQAALTALQERVGALLAMLDPPDGAAGSVRSTTMPGLKPARRGGAPAPAPRSRQRRARGYGRRRMQPTAHRIHAIAHCPHCATALSGGTIRRTREVIEVPPSPATVTAPVYVERRCPRCRGRWLPGPELEEAVVGQGRFGVELLSLIATLREELRLPIARIQWYLEAVHGLHLSVGAIVAALHLVAARAAPIVAGIGERIRASSVLHVDETGWREDGHNGYVWTCSTPAERLFVRGSRERAMLEATIGNAYGGVLVSDFYAAYTSYEGRHQYCWAHLLRDIDDLVSQHPSDTVVRGWAAAIHALYQRATADAADAARDVHWRRQGYEAELEALCVLFLGDDTAPQRVLCARITKHLSALFVFVDDPAVPATNNAAERSLRHLVTCRKISGGTRSPAGTATKMTLASLFGTWRLQGLNPLDACRALLTQSQV
ncbi:MAG TPA: IS66 family transposase [Longimicrobium sp.]|nr:IS66 family transposase [Longimicrobium sp.]